MKPLKELDAAAVLLAGARAELDAASHILTGLKTGTLTACRRLPKQGELFSYLTEENEALAILCLNSLVETL